MPSISAAQRNSRQRRMESPPRRAMPPLDGMASTQGMQLMGLMSGEVKPPNETHQLSGDGEEDGGRISGGQLGG